MEMADAVVVVVVTEVVVSVEEEIEAGVTVEAVVERERV